MKVLLINPPYKTNYPSPPLGLAYIAAVLEKEEHKVKIIDAPALSIGLNGLKKLISKKTFDIYGIHSVTPTINSVIKVSKLIRNLKPESKIIVGGPHVTLLPKETLKIVPEIDIIVRGEGESTIVELCKILEKEGSLNKIKGIAFRENQEIKITPFQSYIKNLDDLPFPAYDLLPLQNYRPHPPFGINSPFMTMISSRGCPFRCVFCSKPVFGNKVRTRSPENIVDEIEFLIGKYKIKEIQFYDDVFTIDKKRVQMICSEIKERKLDFSWTCETRVNLVSKDILRKMKQAGCYMIAYGVESGSQRILNTLKKDITIKQIYNAFKITKEEKLRILAYFMLGTPGENEADIRKTINFAKDLNPDYVQFSLTTPYPGTELFKTLFNDQSFHLADWNEFSYAKVGGKTTSVHQTGNLKREHLEKLLIRAYKEFYIRPAHIRKSFSKITSISELKIWLRGTISLLRTFTN